MCQSDWQLFILVLFEKAFIQLSNAGSYVSKQFFKEKLLALICEAFVCNIQAIETKKLKKLTVENKTQK